MRAGGRGEGGGWYDWLRGVSAVGLGFGMDGGGGGGLSFETKDVVGGFGGGGAGVLEVDCF